MVQYSSLYGINPNCVTGDQDHLYVRLREAIRKARRIDIIVAFLMESGVRLLENDFKEAIEQGAALRILCGNYLNITQPQALYLLKSALGDRVDLRFYNVPNKSFHPKAYIFEYAEDGEIFIGSSNVSRSALTDGIEWNYRISSAVALEDYEHFKHTFENLFLNQSIIVDDDEMRRYSRNWKRPKLFYDLERLEDGIRQDGRQELAKVAGTSAAYIIDTEEQTECQVIEYPCPMGAQIEALYELNQSRTEGWDKGIIVAATGVGKTFLAAFDSKGFEKILFVAHREEILRQAERAFKCVRSEKTTGFFSGDEKVRDCDILFATIQTIGRKEYLNAGSFSKEAFDYIIVDEFHHAVAESYKGLIGYFRPKFLLGLTATPERLDNQDVFALCDYNTVYDVRLKEAINKGWLVPFRYYGVFDDTTDYDEISYSKGKYDEKQLEEALSIGKRADLILKHYLKYNSRRALGFCSGRGHAVYMAKYFMENGVKACAVISGAGSVNSFDASNNGNASYILDRKVAVEKLKAEKISVVFSVDIFNEGLDIPEVDSILFLRPTESPTVFLQQLGRGLRKKGNKKYVNVLDFIGNYKKANLVPFLLTGDVKYITKRTETAYLPNETDYPEDCFVDYDLRLIDLFKKMEGDQKKLFERVKDEYFRIKEEQEEKPLRFSMYMHLDEGIRLTLYSGNKMNIFKDYLSFLDKIGELSDEEAALMGTKAHDFLKAMENTEMSKLYKMPLLAAFYNSGEMKLSVDEDDIYESFREFYSHGPNAIDLLRDKGTSNYKDWGKREYVRLAKRNPMHFLMRSSAEFFYEEDNRFCLTPELGEFMSNPAFAAHFGDIIEYRTKKFYRERLRHREDAGEEFDNVEDEDK